MPLLDPPRPRAAAAVDRRELIRGVALGLAAASLGGRPWPAFGSGTDFPEPSFVRTNGIRMAVYERGSGPAVVLCHGFPELAYSWRHQLPALAEAGFHAIAPDQRGYGLSDRPDSVEAYDIEHLCGDLIGLLDARQIDRAVFCGHDWGGGVVWNLALLHPDRVAGVIGVNTAFRAPTPVRPIEFLRRLLGENNYIVAFQTPGVADAALAKDVRKSFALMMRRGGLMNAEAFAKLPPNAPERRFELLEMLQAPEESYPGELLLNEEELEFFVRTFSRTGFTGGINWYRNIDRNWERTRTLEHRIDVPCLYVGAEDDVVLPPSSADGMERLVPDLEKHTIADCGHWTQQEKPAELNRILTAWLQRRFGGSPV